MVHETTTTIFARELFHHNLQYNFMKDVLKNDETEEHLVDVLLRYLHFFKTSISEKPRYNSIILSAFCYLAPFVREIQASFETS